MRARGIIVVLLTLAAACGHRELRGRTSASPDGRTYLVIDDDDGGHCGPFRVDGRVWPHGLGVRGRVSPGVHVVSCGASLEARVDSGQTFRLDYWGP